MNIELSTENHKFHICILRMWVRSLYVIYWIASAFLARKAEDTLSAKSTAHNHIKLCDDQVEWFLK